MKRSVHIFFFLVISFLSMSQISFARSLRASPPTGIDKIENIEIGGIKQYITIKGDDNTKPILLFLHGGPGGSVIDQSGRFTRELQKNFIVVQWDQRETNKTLQLNASPVPLTIQLIQNDTHELIEYLLKQFDQKKLYLAGYSWGTVLGFYIADKYPDLLYAYIAISPVVNQYESEQMTLAMLKQQAEETGNETEKQELAQVKIPFENSKQLYYARKWLFAFDGNPIRNADTSSMILYFQRWAHTWLPVWNESLKQNRVKEISALNCPIYFFVGRKDHQTNFTIAEQYYNSLMAAKKKLYWFEKSAHTIINTEPALLQDIIIKQILPETF
ncbi:MAG: alpha/beta hydrolase fold protein [Sediminibacterium sp.]|nr:alpha/beta hydrolase fold protein [Sediminibacterium sp.]